MNLLVTENRNGWGEHREQNTVRIFLQDNLDYGLWIAEDYLFSLLTEAQQKQYREDTSYQGDHFEISYEVGRKLLKAGRTPYRKQILYKEKED